MTKNANSEDKDLSTDNANKAITPGKGRDSEKGVNRDVRVPVSKRIDLPTQMGPLYVDEDHKHAGFHQEWVNDTPGTVDHYIDRLKFSYVLDLQTGQPKVAQISHGKCSQAFLLELPLEEYELRRQEDRAEEMRKRTQSIQSKDGDLVPAELKTGKRYTI